MFSSAWLVSEQKSLDVLAKAILYPNLLEGSNRVSQIKVRNNEREITLIKVEQEWMISENDNFLAKIEPIRRALLQVAGLKKIERNPPRKLGIVLGVNDLGERGIPDSR